MTDDVTRTGAPPDRVATLEVQLKSAYEEIERTNSELLQLTLELDDRVAERTKALSEANRKLAQEIRERRATQLELERHKNHLEELVDERTEALARANTELALRLRELEASEERFRSLVLTIPDIIYRIDVDGRFTFLNDAIRRLGYEPDDLVGQHFGAVIAAEDVQRVSRRFVLPQLAGRVTGPEDAPKLFDERRTGERKTTGLEVRLKIRSGGATEPGLVQAIGKEFVEVEINSSGLYELPLSEAKKVFVGTVGVIRDITDRKAMERDLKRAYQELERANESLEDKVRARTTELRQANRTLNIEIQSRMRAERELQEALDALTSSQPKLIQAEKMSAIGTMTAGMAHELNNPLMGILTFIQYARRKLEGPARLEPVLADAERETVRCIDLVKNLLTISRYSPLDDTSRAKVHVASLIERIVRLLQYRSDKLGVTIETTVDEGVPGIMANQDHLTQVFMNILSNALDVLESRQEREVHIHVGGDTHHVVVTISDSGGGIPEAIQKRVFDPFFTTKPPDRGTGLGLAVCRSIVTAHGGTIDVTTGRGTSTFEVRLPLEPPAGTHDERST